ncbi:PDF receptor-like [Homarus americanus]|uniref:PDF receptor-like n=1 Tax=Homarus americanus TaxID=6706 RepID=UPI001C468413|nr:PDF receptor-like [Homarus americanus]
MATKVRLKIIDKRTAPSRSQITGTAYGTLNVPFTRIFSSNDGYTAICRDYRDADTILSPEGMQAFGGVYCNTTWDTLYCWPATQAGRTVSESCATVFSDVPDLLNYPKAFAYRECDSTGSWLWDGWTNYSQCLSVIENQAGRSGVLDAVRYITFIGALLSLLTLTLTIFIFTYFRTLECDRLRVHRNLVVSLIVWFLVMLILTEPFISHRHTRTYRDVDWLCKTLLTLRMYAQMASINWMFVEGLFLHSRLTSNVFDSGAPFTLYYIIGWGWPLVFLAAWATTMALHYPVQCWRGYGNLLYIWILVAPMVTALMAILLRNNSWGRADHISVNIKYSSSPYMSPAKVLEA